MAQSQLPQRRVDSPGSGDADGGPGGAGHAAGRNHVVRGPARGLLLAVCGGAPALDERWHRARVGPHAEHLVTAQRGRRQPQSRTNIPRGAWEADRGGHLQSGVVMTRRLLHGCASQRDVHPRQQQSHPRADASTRRHSAKRALPGMEAVRLKRRLWADQSQGAVASSFCFSASRDRPSKPCP